MVDQITLGSRIRVNVVKTPTNTAAMKTLTRLFAKDQVFARENKRQAKVRHKHFRTVPRGGRRYPIYVHKKFPVKGTVGESGNLVATADVLADLGSIQRFVEVVPSG